MQEGKKYIHYCWFGDAKLSHLAKKCIKSWKKYLPDYEIVCWNEKNSDLNECPFVKEAYENKKWAFVADYVRAKALYEYGGIYLDTDMKITKDISRLLEDNNFLGVEDSGAIAVGVWGVKKAKDELPKKLINFYKKQKHFNKWDLYAITIPKVITNILTKYGFEPGKDVVQKLVDGTVIYPREYFYPLSYNYHNNRFTENTCMIHYYDASWASREEKRTIWLIRKLGPRKATILMKLLSKIKALFVYYGKVFRRTLQILFFPIHFVEKRLDGKNKKKLEAVAKEIRRHSEEYIVFTKDGWLGVGSSTEDMFGKVIYLPDLTGKNSSKIIADALIGNKKLKMVLFSGFAEGWEWLIEEIKVRNPDLTFKVFWHGSNAMHLEELDWDRFKTVFGLLNSGLINEVAFAKKSMFEQYKQIGYNVCFLPNNFIMPKEKREKYIEETDNHDGVRIGIYASGDRWVKNFYNQVAAASLINNAEVDVIPITSTMIEYARILKINIIGEEDSIPRDEMLKRITKNDIVLYTTFVECAPILPLECLELGVLCITGNNHHYWQGTPLEKYLVEPCVDNPVAIAERIRLCLKNKDTIMKLYKEWKKEYNSYCKEEIKKFLGDNR